MFGDVGISLASFMCELLLLRLEASNKIFYRMGQSRQRNSVGLKKKIMSEHKILLIRESISIARRHEAKSGELLRYLEALAPRLHQTIQLPGDRPAQALLEFVTRYVEHVPDFLEALTELMQQAKIYHHGKVFITIAEDFFLHPPEITHQHHGLHALIDEAYLAHRLMEEVNDRVLMSCGVPLTPMDMTLSNIVVHDVLGEEYANKLDLAVHFAIETLFDSSNLIGSALLADFVSKNSRRDWDQLLKQWPCLAGDSSISLHFADEACKSLKSPLH